LIRFSHSFRAPGAPAEIFALLADPARVAPCVPGAALDDDAPAGELREGAELGGRMQLRLGPVSARFRAVVRVLELDRDARRTVLGVRAQDESGNGSAQATITLSVDDDGGDAALVTVATALEFRGRIATFGVGAVQRVSARILDRFAENLAAVAAAGAPAAAAEPHAAPRAPELRMRELAGPAPAFAWPLLATASAFACGVLVGVAVRARGRSRRWAFGA
jgi:uncharacterized protein